MDFEIMAVLCFMGGLMGLGLLGLGVLIHGFYNRHSKKQHGRLDNCGTLPDMRIRGRVHGNGNDMENGGGK